MFEKFFRGIATCIEQALEEAYEHCLIDWLPTDGAPDTFEATVEIAYSPSTGAYQSRDIYVTLTTSVGEILVFISAYSLVKWLSTRMDTLVL